MRWTKGCKPGIQYKISKKQFHLLHPPVLLVVESSQLGHFQVWQQSCFKCGTMHWFPRMEFYISPVSVCKYFWVSVKKYFSSHRQDFCPVSRKTRCPNGHRKRMKFCGLSGHLEPGAHPLWQPHLFGQLIQHLCLHLLHNKVTATIDLQQHHCNNCNVIDTLQQIELHQLHCNNWTATIELQQLHCNNWTATRLYPRTQNWPQKLLDPNIQRKINSLTGSGMPSKKSWDERLCLHQKWAKESKDVWGCRYYPQVWSCCVICVKFKL